MIPLNFITSKKAVILSTVLSVFTMTLLQTDIARAETGSGEQQDHSSSFVSVSDSLDSLEKKYGIQQSQDRSVLDRLSTLEIHAFGNIKQGSLVERVRALRSAPGHKDKPEPMPDKSLERWQGETIEHYVKRLNKVVPYGNTQPVRLYRITPVNRTIKASPDYLSIILKATKKKVLRFKEMPIPVYITPLRSKNYMSACIKGFEAWESRTTGNIRFVQVTDPKQARIRVVWKQLGMGKDKNDCALGAHTVTKWKKRGKGKVAVMSVGAIPVPLYIPRFGPKYKVPPQVIEVNTDLIDSKRQEIKFIVLKNIVTHELGHALGILGHSNLRSDMMYPITDQHSRISTRDLNTLSKLYSLKVDIPL